MERPRRRGDFGRHLVNRWHTLRALAWMCRMRAGLRCFGFARVSRNQARLARVRAPESPLPTVPRLMRSVERARHYLPGRDTCLPDALAGQVLLGRAGFASEIQFGVEPGACGRPIRAHAWLVCRGHVVLGEPEEGRYSTLEVSRDA